MAEHWQDHEIQELLSIWGEEIGHRFRGLCVATVTDGTIASLLKEWGLDTETGGKQAEGSGKYIS